MDYPSYPWAAMHIQYVVGTEGDDQCQLSYANEHLAESSTVTLFSFHPHAQIHRVPKRYLRTDHLKHVLAAGKE
jgi:hypothetical protein